MAELVQRIVTCEVGHFYDANRYETCPHCNNGGYAVAISRNVVGGESHGVMASAPAQQVAPQQQGSFAKTVAPQQGSFAKTVAPQRGDFAKTVAPQQGAFAKTVAPQQGSFAKTVAPQRGDFAKTVAPQQGSFAKTVAPQQGSFAKTVAPSQQGSFAKTIAPHGVGGASEEVYGGGGAEGTVAPNVDAYERGAYGHTRHSNEAGTEGFGQKPSTGNRESGAGFPVVGWLVALNGVNRGKDYRIHEAYNYIGRERGDICIRGDMAVSAECDTIIRYVPQTREFYVAHGRGKNGVLVNDQSIGAEAVRLANYDVLTVGNTNLVFVALCGTKFNWEVGASSHD
ncbi:MAG: FHA domain-containing protein [Atopobiaceae bacterium]|nr:FHA domain-containing protein [Atopobiaceae bacterium]